MSALIIFAQPTHADYYYYYEFTFDEDMVWILNGGVWSGDGFAITDPEDFKSPVENVVIGGHIYDNITNVQLSDSLFTFTATSSDGGDPLTFTNLEGEDNEYGMETTGNPFTAPSEDDTIANTWFDWVYANGNPALNIQGGSWLDLDYGPPDQLFTVNLSGTSLIARSGASGESVSKLLIFSSDASPVPEPATVVAMFASICMFGIRRIFKKR